MRKYFHNKSNVSSTHKAMVLADLKHSPLNLADLNLNQMQAWKEKELHESFINQLNQQGIDCCASNKKVL
jgi:hypothetical protein